jgi:hypothetical protein
MQEREAAVVARRGAIFPGRWAAIRHVWRDRESESLKTDYGRRLCGLGMT